MRVPGLLPLAALAAFVGAAQAEPAHTTRIESRPISGATVTVENGVRVWRPIPPTTHLIINPDKAPLVLSVENPSATYHAR